MRDLAYGEVLFHFYQQDYFSALRRLLAAQTRGELTQEAGEAELLLGGLSLSYGLHQEAGRIFRALLDERIEPAVRDRAWMYLGKIYYQRGYLEQARDALSRLGEGAPADTRAEARLLEALVRLRSGDAAGASALLQDWEAPGVWRGYALYNQAVAAIRAGDVARGESLLDRLGELPGEDEEALALRDKAQLVLGVRRLEAGQAQQAMGHFERVRLHGPAAGEALLGAGWAAIAAGEPQRALGRWGELRRRSLYDPSTREAALAVPYALAQLGRYGHAAEAYEAAITDFTREAAQMDAAIAAIRAGRLVDWMLEPTQSGPELGWFRELWRLPDRPETRYLPDLMAGHDFQEAYKNLRDLSFLRQNLAAWTGSMGAFDEMLAVRRAGYEAAVPRVDAYLRALDLDGLRARRAALARQLAAVDSGADELGLRSPQEDALLAQFEALGERLRRLSNADDPEVQGLRDKYRVLEGLVTWSIRTEGPARRWQVERGLQEIDAQLAEAEARQAALVEARGSARAGFEGYGERIAELRARVQALDLRTEALVRAHAEHLARLAEAELLAQRRRLELYRQQAQFSLAQMYDRAAQRGEAGP